MGYRWLIEDLRENAANEYPLSLLRRAAAVIEKQSTELRELRARIDTLQTAADYEPPPPATARRPRRTEPYPTTKPFDRRCRTPPCAGGFSFWGERRLRDGTYTRTVEEHALQRRAEVVQLLRHRSRRSHWHDRRGGRRHKDAEANARLIAQSPAC